ncbi:CobW family GTP-binding protein [Natronobacterium gregoryi]|uniref:Cobalamin synthesis protein P47K n=2 Tax=Natronobacterium gregoryi TaxID=44930 RepID=L0AF21_NATGS|nr:GTP-binding protein [Natronobacterium gregoryi]AFZ72518.1 putative GTPase, G3E family [Natronobacterium gregoryi SP2]ELY74391.1 cobalamin synthesis protein P47K [Natronobacterium gregoryi SP2]PLK21487.1 GTP-binding protein [Natronobacterium gregoryi SP2]SFI76598.1 GTPase, G3E family [Natronobacterium gregoryi]
MSVPVTVLCGELGAGKTTLLSGLLESPDTDTEREIAVLVNDVGAVNVDADLVEARTDLATGEEVVALENGCICCSLGGELSRAVIRLWKEHEFDHLVVEASGVGEPEPIARQFVHGPAGGPYDLEAVVTVVDARRFHDRFADVDLAADEVPAVRGGNESEDGDGDGTRPLTDLVLEQVEFCDLLVVNKCDLVDDAERERVVALLEALQPRADVLTTEYGAIDPAALLGVDRFDLEAASEAAGWKRAIEADVDDEAVPEHDDDHEDGHGHDHDHDEAHDHAHPPERYGIAVDAYHRRRPFHPERFAAVLADLPNGLVRVKGLCWIAGREDQAITMSYAGTETSLEVTGRWIASFSEERQETYRQGQPDLEWDEEWGDRETRLAVIGRDLAFDALEARFDDCLLTDAEMDEDWHEYDNRAPTAMGETTVVDTDSL